MEKVSGFVQTPLLEEPASHDSEDPNVQGIRASFAGKQPFEYRFARDSVAVFLASEEASFCHWPYPSRRWRLTSSSVEDRKLAFLDMGSFWGLF